METSYSGKIAEQRLKIEEEIAQLSERLKQLRAELADLDVADRVIGRIIDGRAGAVSGKSRKPSKRLRSDKAVGLPTLQDMILNVLRKAKLEGRTALEPKEIASLIAKNYSPDVKRDSINAVAWTMWKRATLSKSGGAYTLPASDQA
jgi:hypothetical protein